MFLVEDTAWGGKWLIPYIGAGFVAFGLFVLIPTALSSFALTTFVVLGAVVVAMGLVLVALGLQIKPSRQPVAEDCDDEDWELEFLLISLT